MARVREKNSTDDYRALDVRTMQRDGLFAGPWRGNWRWYRNGKEIASVGIETCRDHIQLRYQSRSGDGEPVQHDYLVSVTWTPCHLGGERPWFNCPTCNKRVAKLYGGSVFTCRHCMRLNYRCQQISKRDQALERSWSLRRRLGTDAGPFDVPAEYLWRPKGMHRKTFAKHIEKLTHIDQQAVGSFEVLIGKLKHKVR